MQRRPSDRGLPPERDPVVSVAFVSIDCMFYPPRVPGAEVTRKLRVNLAARGGGGGHAGNRVWLAKRPRRRARVGRRVRSRRKLRSPRSDRKSTRLNSSHSQISY